MSGLRLILRSLWHYRRTQLGVLLATAVGAAVLTGALIVGDCVRYTLRQMALARIGDADLAMIGNDRFVRTALAEELQSKIRAEEYSTAIKLQYNELQQKAIDEFTIAPVLMVQGIATTPENDARANHVQVVGVDDRFFALSPTGGGPAAPDAEGVILNQSLAHQLNVAKGDRIVLRVSKPSALPRDMPLASDEDTTVALSVTVNEVIGDDQFGRFSLRAEQTPPFNAFVSLNWLGEQLEVPAKANLFLTTRFDNGATRVDRHLKETWNLEDADLTIADLENQPLRQIETGRVFLDEPVIDAVSDAFDVRQTILTYFVNDLKVGDQGTPYSMVTAASGLAVTDDLKDDEAAITQWLADDRGAKIGDQLTMSYFVVGPGRKLIEKSASFTIRKIIPMNDPAADQMLMPAFPGLAEHDNCRDWTPGIPVDLDRIRDKDEKYWDDYRGTPKAFISLAAGQRLWENRFGKLTAIRIADTKTEPNALLSSLSPASIGLYFTDIRSPALSASSASFDFGQLFLGLSFFLMIAALLLTAMGFVFGVEQRAEQIGTLLAVGFTPRKIMRLLMAEGFILALIGSVIGMFLGMGYTRVILIALNDNWQDAVASAAIQYHATPATLAIGWISGTLTALLAMWLAARSQSRRTIKDLLSSGSQSDKRLATGGSKGMALAVVCAIGAIVIAATSDTQKQAAGAFFGIGSLLLISLLAWCQWFFSIRQTGKPVRTAKQLAMRNTARRRGRSLATVAMLACGCFLVTAVGINRHDPAANADQRASGSGGFALYAQSVLPVLEDLNDPAARENLNLFGDFMDGVSFVTLRVRDGDDASCLNLNRAQQPRLLGVRPADLNLRNSFDFVAGVEDVYKKARWDLLNLAQDDGAIAAIGDDATVKWALGKGVGDTVDYVDEFGRPLKLRIIGTVGNSILQGSLIISETNFEKLFPSESGYRVFLIDAPAEHAANVSSELTQALSDHGLEVTRTVDRLRMFGAVENTYLSIFQVLGGLGLALGSVGLGMVVLRNLQERRTELAVLAAVGYSRSQLRFLALWEHGLLLKLGLFVGTACALIAVWPVLQHRVETATLIITAITVIGMVIFGLLWVWLAASLAMRRNVIESLREE